MTDDSTGATLPPAARDRMAEIRGSGTWGSALSTDEFTAIRGVGFEPVGQVLGACVYNIGYAGGYACPGGWSSGVFGGVVTAATQVSGQGGWGTFGPLTQAMYDARRKAIGRMGADGVVVSTYDLRVRARECPVREGSRDHIAEVTIVGTATAQFSSPAVATPPGSLAVLSLDPQRRQVARVRLGR